MPLRVDDCMGIMAEIAPPEYAESWDPVGLQVGHPQQPVRRMGVALDATFEVVSEAIQEGVDFLVVHHPLFFRPLKNLDLGAPAGRIIGAAVRNSLSIYAAHTNLDSVPGGLNDALCQKIGLARIEPLTEGKKRSQTLLHVEVPAKMKDRVHRLFEETDGGVVWWASMDTEGVIGRARLATDRVRGIRARLHALCPEARVDGIPAGEILSGAGLGRVGDLPGPLCLEAFAEKTKKDLDLTHVRMVGDPMRAVRRVAVCTGSGAGLMSDALKVGADVLLTGDVKYHEAMEVLDQGFSLVDAGHFGTESMVVDLLVERLAGALKARDIQGVGIVPFSSRKDPFLTV